VISRVRLFLVLTRPAVAFLFCVYVVIGLAKAGDTGTGLRLFQDLLVVIGFLIFSVAVNDLSDAPIDRQNLPNSNRPLVTGRADEREMKIVALTAAVVAVGVAALGGWPLLALAVGGLALSAAYSLPPLRLADRGAVAALVLPAGYVAVPFLVGLLSVRTSVTLDDRLLLVGLYVGFIGRILLKDFRDVRGDALFGKRTFLVRRGRRATCAVSAMFWTAGGALVVATTPHTTAAYVATTSAGLVGVLVLLRMLANERSARRDEAIISGIAIIGRTVLVLLVAQLSMTDKHWLPLRANVMLACIAVVAAGAVRSMLVHGPRSNLVMPAQPAEDQPAPDEIPRLIAAGDSGRRPG
jgi:4-hydroxybenzoate polyprenyltransferase